MSKSHHIGLAGVAGYVISRVMPMLTVNSSYRAAAVCIGLSSQNASLSRPPGWENESYGYHGDDGDIYSQQSSGKSYGPSFGAPDVVGCGVNFHTKTIFFTRNGKYLSTHSGPRASTSCSFVLTAVYLDRYGRP